MKQSHYKQRGFAAPALFVAVIVAFAGSLGVKNDEGETLASAIGIVENPSQTEFAATEVKE